MTTLVRADRRVRFLYDESLPTITAASSSSARAQVVFVATGVLRAGTTRGQARSVTTLERGVDIVYNTELRELQVDFENPALAIILSGLSTSHRPDAISFDHLRAFSMGPRELNDLANTVYDRPWYVRCDNAAGHVYIAKANTANTVWEAETLRFSFTGEPIIEIDLAFDLLGRPVIVCERATGTAGASEVWIYWAKP